MLDTKLLIETMLTLAADKHSGGIANVDLHNGPRVRVSVDQLRDIEAECNWMWRHTGNTCWPYRATAIVKGVQFSTLLTEKKALDIMEACGFPIRIEEEEEA